MVDCVVDGFDSAALGVRCKAASAVVAWVVAAGVVASAGTTFDPSTAVQPAKIAQVTTARARSALLVFGVVFTAVRCFGWRQDLNRTRNFTAAFDFQLSISDDA